MSSGRSGCQLLRRDRQESPQFGCSESRWSIEANRCDALGSGPDGSSVSPIVGLVQSPPSPGRSSFSTVVSRFGPEHDPQASQSGGVDFPDRGKFNMFIYHSREILMI